MPDRRREKKVPDGQLGFEVEFGQLVLKEGDINRSSEVELPENPDDTFDISSPPKRPLIEKKAPTRVDIDG